MPRVTKIEKPITPAQQVVRYAFERGWLCDTMRNDHYIVVKGGFSPIAVARDLAAERIADLKKRFNR